MAVQPDLKYGDTKMNGGLPDPKAIECYCATVIAFMEEQPVFPEKTEFVQSTHELGRIVYPHACYDRTSSNCSYSYYTEQRDLLLACKTIDQKLKIALEKANKRTNVGDICRLTSTLLIVN